jgi:hypothetical protein
VSWRLIVLLTALVLFAPSQDGDAAEVLDTQAEHVCDALVTQVAVALPAPTQARVTIARADEAPPPTPARSRIFRPPRPSLD